MLEIPKNDLYENSSRQPEIQSKMDPRRMRNGPKES